MKKFLSRILFRLAKYKFHPFRLQCLYYGYIFYGDAEKELVHLERIIDPKRLNTAIDIGANEGFWTYKLSKFFTQVHSFEINPNVSEVIATSNISNIDLHDIGLSDSVAEKEFYIPINENKHIEGWGSLEKRELDFTTTFETKRFKVTPLDSYNFKNIDFIKIDVEGHELNVLKGAKNTILQNFPILVIESEGATLDAVKNFLLPLGYKSILLKDILDIKGSWQNHIFIPN